MVTHELQGQVQVYPIGDGDEADEAGHKQITIVCGPNALYSVPMDASLVTELVKEMSMTNAELRAKREREIREARSRQLLAGGQGNGGMPAIPLDQLRARGQ